MKVTLGSDKGTDKDLGKLQEMYESMGVHVTRIPSATTDSVFHRDVVAWTPHGLIKCSMGKKLRANEPDAWFDKMGINPLLDVAKVSNSATFEGADLIWVNPSEAIIGIGKRTNREGAKIVRDFLEENTNCEVLTVQLPSWQAQHLLGVVNSYNGIVFTVTTQLVGMINITHPVKMVTREHWEKRTINFVTVWPTSSSLHPNAPSIPVLILPELSPGPVPDECLELLVGESGMVLVPIPSLLKRDGGIACATGIYEM